MIKHCWTWLTDSLIFVQYADNYIENHDELLCNIYSDDDVNNYINRDVKRLKLAKIILLQCCSSFLLLSLTLIFNNTLKTGIYPSEWANETYKKGNVKCVNNYRGIFLVDIFGKVFCIILNERLFSDYFEEIQEART